MKLRIRVILQNSQIKVYFFLRTVYPDFYSFLFLNEEPSLHKCKLAKPVSFCTVPVPREDAAGSDYADDAPRDAVQSPLEISFIAKHAKSSIVFANF